MRYDKAFVLAVFLVTCLCSMPHFAWAVEVGSSFRDVLETAELGPEVLARFPDNSADDAEEWEAEDWQLLIQLLHRLGQHPTSQLADWVLKRGESSPEALVGDLVDIVGMVEAVEVLELPEPIAEAHDMKSLYRCRIRIEDSADGKSDILATVLSARIPRGWQISKEMGEPIGFRGILLRNSLGESFDDDSQTKALFLAPYLAWYPREGVPTGQLLLAKHGMDVALLEEVKHRQPFVELKVSREGEAFYGCLAAMKSVDSGELTALSKQSVSRLAEDWRESKATDQQQRAIAARVVQRSELGLSSVAPLFLQPEQMTGRLVRIEGTARRAVRIAVVDQSELDSYFEVEIFPPDSQNQPIVCCVNDLPTEFPTGDAIREPVRVSGVFFKSWLYRSRLVQQTEGATDRQQRMYTPVVVGAVEWLPRSASSTGLWGLWGGIAFLVVLIIVAANALRLAKRDRLARAARRHAEDVELPKN